jgi:hypothetical protein
VAVRAEIRAQNALVMDTARTAFPGIDSLQDDMLVEHIAHSMR